MPRPNALARRYMRAHQKNSEAVRNKPVSNHQPPSFIGGKLRPYTGAGGSRASQNSWRTNWIGSQLTEANMLKPMMLKAKVPRMSEARPKPPR